MEKQEKQWKGGMVEEWKDGTTKRKGKMEYWKNGRLEEWKNGKTRERQNSGRIEDRVIITLKILVIYGISNAWIAKISIEGLGSFGYGKTPFPFTFWRVKYFSTSHSNSRKLLRMPSILLTASQGTSQKAIVDVVLKST